MPEENKNEFSSLKELWDLFCSINASQGVDLPKLVHLLVRRERQLLEEWSTKGDFDELCRIGCSQVSLAVAVWGIKQSQSIEQIWRSTVLSARRRKQGVRILERAADVLEELQASFVIASFQDFKKTLPEDLRNSPTLEAEILRIVSEKRAKLPEYAPAPHPLAIARALRLYARTLGMFPALSEEIQAPSSDSIPRYVISAYVKRATGEFHDPQVSALIGSALGTGTYDETAHRMWRSRNYEQLEKTGSGFVDFLIDLGVVVPPNM